MTAAILKPALASLRRGIARRRLVRAIYEAHGMRRDLELLNLHKTWHEDALTESERQVEVCRRRAFEQ